MRRSFTRISNANALLACALLGALLNCLASEVALSDPRESVFLKAATPDIPSCDSDDVVVFQSNPSPLIGLPCDSHRKTLIEASASRAYLNRDCPAGLHHDPAGARTRNRPSPPSIRRQACKYDSGSERSRVGFRWSFLRLSATRLRHWGIRRQIPLASYYGLAVDVYGIGGPGTPEAQLWHDIAAKHGILCPYGPRNPAEWNHCQPTRVKIILAENPLRDRYCRRSNQP
jgi:hypothetical protein